MAIATRSLYIGEFEGLRALMAWWVVFGHVANRIGISYSSELSVLWKVLVMTSVPVDIFIALSGFAIFTMLSKEWNGYPRYIAGRFFRVYPVYFICLIIGIVLFDWRATRMSSDSFVDLSHLTNTAALAKSVTENYWCYVLTHLSMMHGVIPDQLLYGSGHAFIGPAWSLSLEWQFYLVAPLLFLAFNYHNYMILLIGLGLVVFDLVLRSFGLTFSYGAFLPIKIGFFFAGIAAFFYCNQRWMGAGFSMLIALGQALMAVNAKGATLSLVVWLFVATTLLVPNERMLVLTIWMRQFLGSSILRYFGKISFITYLVHIFVVDFVAYILQKHFLQSFSQVGQYFAILIPTIVLTILLSVVIHHGIEAPFMLIGKKFRR